MSTRGVIARTTGEEGAFKGVYNHSDSYPRYMGPHLFHLLQTKFNNNLEKMLISLIDQHSVGWSMVGEECYCHPRRKRAAETQPNWFTDKNIRECTDIEWLWVFDEENKKLFVVDHRHKTDAGIVDLTAPEPTTEEWLRLECGEELERCTHYAWVHFPELKGSNLSTQTYLGKRELDFRDAIAFIINGKRYSSTGTGGHSDFYNRSMFHDRSTKNLKPWPAKTWIASVKAGNGARKDVPVAKITDDEGYTPYPGVTWVLPPTKDNPAETLKGAA